MTNIDLVEKALKHVGDYYWWGCYGQKASADLLNRKSAQYPSVYDSALYVNADKQAEEGRQVWDCVGLIKGLCWGFDDPTKGKYASNGFPDVSADSLYNSADLHGVVSSIPPTPGLGVWRSGHVGIYDGAGGVIEARGHAYGVIASRLKDRDFANWFFIPYIEYTEKKEEAQTMAEDSNTPSEWAKTAWEWATTNGITDGTRPKDNITRQEVIQLLYNIKMKEG